MLDGGLGTLLQAAGLKPGELTESWNITHPDAVRKVHRDYLNAGSDIIVTDTFGAYSTKFAAEGDMALDKVIKAAVKNARDAVAEFESEHPEKKGKSFVALDLGPTGRLLKPFGDLDFEDAVNIFKNTINIAKDLDIDFIYFETMNDIYECKAAVIAAKECCNLPVFLTAAYDERGKLLTGSDPKTVVSVLEGLGVDALGLNCSLGPAQMTGVVKELTEYSSLPVIVKPNAGLPRSENGKTVYDVGPGEFASSMAEIAGMGARLMGGCCGTTPEYIKALSEVLKNLKPLPVTEKDRTLISSYSMALEFKDVPVLIGERINPTGKKAFKEALRNNDTDYILREALKQQDAGCHVLDVNVGLPEIDEAQTLVNAVSEIQAVTNLPLQIDTADPKAMERALRIYNGKPMINSVNGKEEVMDAVFPLAKKYGGLIVALTLDEKGIPKTAEDRVAVAEKIYKRAAEYGIKKKDIIVDPLAMSISADRTSAETSLKCVRMLRERGCLSSLGVSNVSFGLPNRDHINAAFFTMAMQNGLSAGIVNPLSAEMMKAYYSYCALAGKDENFEKYIKYSTEFVTETVKAEKAPGGEAAEGISYSGDGLTDAIIKGLKDSSARYTKELLDSGEAPVSIIDSRLIPALDTVGKGFENKTVFLPQLLMSAEAASASFDIIKGYIKNSGVKTEIKGRIILATVKGDIHDIGKNIVKVLLENYGYEVIDLGKDVAPELIVETAKKERINLIGLSALMTTTVVSMEETIKLVRRELPGAKVVVGGAVLTQAYADMIDADRYSKDAMETVRYAEDVFLASL